MSLIVCQCLQSKSPTIMFMNKTVKWLEHLFITKIYSVFPIAKSLTLVTVPKMFKIVYLHSHLKSIHKLCITVLMAGWMLFATLMFKALCKCKVEQICKKTPYGKAVNSCKQNCSTVNYSCTSQKKCCTV